MGGGILFNTCSELICFHSLAGYNFMCCLEGERGSHAATTCSSQTPSQPRQLNEWTDLTCTVTAVLLEFLQWGHGNRLQEGIGLSLSVAVCISLAEASPWLRASGGGGEILLLLPALYLIIGLIVRLLSQKCLLCLIWKQLHNQVCAMLVPMKAGTGLGCFILLLLFWNGLGGVVNSPISPLSCSYWNSVGSSLGFVPCFFEMFHKQVAQDTTWNILQCSQWIKDLSWSNSILLVVHLWPSMRKKMLLMVSVSLPSLANISQCFFRVASEHLSVKWQHSGFIKSMSAGRRFQSIWKGPPSNKPIKKAREVNMCWELNNAKSCGEILKQYLPLKQENTRKWNCCR